MNATPLPYRDLYFTNQHGLRLYGRHYATVASDRRPVLCLAGLTRNARDFNVIAEALASGPEARDVYCLDMRGRGQSDWDADWKNYAILTELNDVQDFMTLNELHDAAILGTSRGGLLAMALAATQPGRLGAVVLNDIGPVIELSGLKRIGGYVGATSTPESWEEAAALCRKVAGRDFPDVDEAEWLEIARQWFNEGPDSEPRAGYDPALGKSFAASVDGIPELWPQFEALKNVPCLTIRGGLSDLLSETTVAQMAERHPSFQSFVVENQGHAPLLRDTPTIEVVRSFLRETD